MENANVDSVVKKKKKAPAEVVAPRPDSNEWDLYIDYWRLQHERVAAHEGSRYQVAAFVLAGSLVALGFVTDDSAAGSAQKLGGAAIAAINLLAVLFISGERRWIKIHQNRSDAVLRSLSPNLIKAQEDVNRRWKVKTRGDLRHSLLRSSLILSYMHALLAVVTIWLAFA